MMIEKKKKKLPASLHGLVVFFICFSFVLALMVLVFSSLYYERVSGEEGSIRVFSASLSSQISHDIERELREISKDLLILASFSLRSHTEGELVDHYIAFSERKESYEQIRLITFDGLERIRVNYDAGNRKAVEVPRHELQNKSARYYFQEAMNLNEGEIILSQMDLNMENGKLSVPHRPVLRLSTLTRMPDGRKALCVINYRARILLQRISDYVDPYPGRDLSFYLIDQRGNWLYHPHESHCFNFMFNGEHRSSFSADYKEAWSHIEKEESGLLVTDDHFFAFKTIRQPEEHAPRKLSSPYWKYIIHTPPQTLSTIRKEAAIFYRKTSLYFLLPALALSLVIALLAGLNRRHLGKLQNHATYDTLTGCYNLRSGMSLLKETMSHTRRHKSSLFLAFIDINELKKVNDTWGHLEGDNLIHQSTDLFQRSLRGSDFIARIGGDEFIMVLNDSDKEIGQNVMKRIEESFEQFNRLTNLPYSVSASTGWVVYGPQNYSTSMRQLIREADLNMYKIKRDGKEQPDDSDQ